MLFHFCDAGLKDQNGGEWRSDKILKRNRSRCSAWGVGLESNAQGSEGGIMQRKNCGDDKGVIKAPWPSVTFQAPNHAGDKKFKCSSSLRVAERIGTSEQQRNTYERDIVSLTTSIVPTVSKAAAVMQKVQRNLPRPLTPMGTTPRHFSAWINTANRAEHYAKPFIFDILGTNKVSTHPKAAHGQKNANRQLPQPSPSHSPQQQQKCLYHAPRN